ncbi:hypothetical protein Tco_0448816 [Tanacetum coccineum]
MEPFEGGLLRHSKEHQDRGLNKTGSKFNIIACEYISIISIHIHIKINEMVTVLGPRERNIDEYWWRIYKSGDREVLES